MGYKRIANGIHLLEWEPDEKIVRCYSVIDVTLPLQEWTVEVMKQRYKPSPDELAKLEYRWEQQGRIVRSA